MARVTCRCQPVPDRTSYWSSPTYGEGHVPVPAGPGPDLVLVEPDLALRRLEAGLDRPAPPRRPHQRRQAGALGRPGQVEGQLVRLVELAPDQEALRPTVRGAAPVGRV